MLEKYSLTAMVEQVLFHFSYPNFSIIQTLVSIQLTIGVRISELALYNEELKVTIAQSGDVISYASPMQEWGRT